MVVAVRQPDALTTFSGLTSASPGTMTVIISEAAVGGPDGIAVAANPSNPASPPFIT
jgi:hypothetical protein